MHILVAGGAGYIGSHTCIALLKAGHSLVVADNLSNSRRETIDYIKQVVGRDLVFNQLDVTDSTLVDPLFAQHSFDAVIHFAGFKSVSESVAKPLAYFYNNTVSTMVLAGACLKHGVGRFIYSSSAAVYGDNQAPFVEDMALKPAASPYGETKLVSENILAGLVKANPGLSVALLRYFNPVGAHESGLLGESPLGEPNNLMPYILRVAKGKMDRLHIFGGDYPTIDGTGVRDYIHVCDLAEGHVASLANLSRGLSLYNLGTGRGTSVLQLVKAFEQANKVVIPYEIVARRPGDTAECYADASKAKRELGWIATRDLLAMCRDAWRFEQAQD